MKTVFCLEPLFQKRLSPSVPAYLENQLKAKLQKNFIHIKRWSYKICVFISWSCIGWVNPDDQIFQILGLKGDGATLAQSLGVCPETGGLPVWAPELSVLYPWAKLFTHPACWWWSVSPEAPAHHICQTAERQLCPQCRSLTPSVCEQVSNWI